MDEKSIICFLTVNPGKLFYHFVKQIPNPERIYICIDDNNHEIPDYDGEIKIIKINNKDSFENGFHSTVFSLQNKACSRDKALYYFGTRDIDFNHIWFIEDDVFIPTTTTIDYLDNKYPRGDLLCAANSVVNTQSDIEKSNWSMWDNCSVKIRYPLPWASSMICAIRCSKRLLDCIQNYAKNHGGLFLDEIFFNTVALHNNLTILPIDELSGVVWRQKWKKHDNPPVGTFGGGSLKPTHLYHPVKSISEQYKLRIPGTKDPKALNWVMILCIICGISLVTVSLILCYRCEKC